MEQTFVRHPRAPSRHPREGGEPETQSTALDSRLRGNDGSAYEGDSEREPARNAV